MLKLAVIGGGSSYTPELIQGVLREQDRMPIAEVVLLDTPAGEEKVSVVCALAQRMARAAGRAVSMRYTLDPDDALDGADFVVSQFRAGGLAGRWRDEHLPLRYHLLGQETTGAGGFANALRTVPQALSLAARMHRRCPGAWLVNFTNPSGIVTEALLKHGFGRTIGLCNVAIGVEKGLARILGIAASRVAVSAVGLNHLTWMRLHVDGADMTRPLLGLDGSSLPTAPAVRALQGEWPLPLLEATGMLPNGYLHYYYATQRAVAAEEAAVARGDGTRADQVMRLEAQLFQLYRDPELTDKPALLDRRGGAYYSEAAVRLMVGLHTGDGPPQVLNVQNRGAVPELPDDAVVEVACRVDREGAHALPPGPMPLLARGLIQSVKAYEELTVEAARTADRGLAYAALAAHPLVRDADLAQRLLEDILRENAADLPQAWTGR